MRKVFNRFILCMEIGEAVKAMRREMKWTQNFSSICFASMEQIERMTFAVKKVRNFIATF